MTGFSFAGISGTSVRVSSSCPCEVITSSCLVTQNYSLTTFWNIHLGTLYFFSHLNRSITNLTVYKSILRIKLTYLLRSKAFYSKMLLPLHSSDGIKKKRGGGGGCPRPFVSLLRTFLGIHAEHTLKLLHRIGLL